MLVLFLFSALLTYFSSSFLRCDGNGKNETAYIKSNQKQERNAIFAGGGGVLGGMLACNMEFFAG